MYSVGYHHPCLTENERQEKAGQIPKALRQIVVKIETGLRFMNECFVFSSYTCHKRDYQYPLSLT